MKTAYFIHVIALLIVLSGCRKSEETASTPISPPEQQFDVQFDDSVALSIQYEASEEIVGLVPYEPPLYVEYRISMLGEIQDHKQNTWVIYVTGYLMRACEGPLQYPYPEYDELTLTRRDSLEHFVTMKPIDAGLIGFYQAGRPARLQVSWTLEKGFGRFVTLRNLGSKFSYHGLIDPTINKATVRLKGGLVL